MELVHQMTVNRYYNCEIKTVGKKRTRTRRRKQEEQDQEEAENCLSVVICGLVHESVYYSLVGDTVY